jgi:predicted ribosome quality control (RQC) complex YloA/Tae2 family protein
MKIMIFTCDNREFQIFIGTNARENWKLIDSSDKNDLWFHVEDYPSGHVIIKEKFNNNIKEKSIIYPSCLIIEGAKQCKYQSKLKDKKCKVVYTTINNVKKGREIGSVFVKNENYIVV